MKLRGGKNIAIHKRNIALTKHVIERFKKRFPVLWWNSGNNAEDIINMFLNGTPQKQTNKYLHVIYKDVRMVAAYPDDKFVILTMMRASDYDV